MNLVELITEWNFDFDPKDLKDLTFATDEIVGFLNEQDPEYISEILRPFIVQAIIADQEEKIAEEDRAYAVYLREEAAYEEVQESYSDPRCECPDFYYGCPVHGPQRRKDEWKGMDGS